MTDDQNRWTITQAKGHFRDLIDRTLRDGPQVITRRGRHVAVSVSAEEWARITRADEPEGGAIQDSPPRDSAGR